MVSSYTVINPSSACRAFATPSCFAKLAYSHATLALPSRCRSQSARAVRPASLAASTRQPSCRQSLVKVWRVGQAGLGVSRKRDHRLRPRVFSVQAPISDHFMQLPVSQRLEPQSSMPERFCTSPFSSAAQRVCRSLGSQGWRASAHVSSSRRERVGSQQPPNPSFKRTRLRRSA